MGANIALVFAGTFPECTDKLVLIEGLGPVIKAETKAPEILRKSIDSEFTYFSKHTRSRKEYATLQDAVKARIRTVTKFPGSQSLSWEAAHNLVSRYSMYTVVDCIIDNIG